MKYMRKLIGIFVVVLFSSGIYAQQESLSNKLLSYSILCYNMGDSLENRYNYKEALEWYKKSYDLNQNLNSVRRIAQCLMKRGQYEQSMCYFNLIPSDSLIHSDFRFKYNLYTKISNVDSLFVLGKEILNKYPYDGDILANLTSMYNKMEMPDSALYYINQYILNDSTNIFVNRQLAFSYFLKKEYLNALNVYNKLQSLHDVNAQTYYYSGLCYAQLDSLNQAYDNLYMANEKEKENPVILSQLGLISVKLGFKEDGIKYIEDAISLYMPDDNLMFNLYDAVSDAYFSRHKYNDCIEGLNRCLQLNSSYFYTYYKIARTYGAMKDRKKEKLYYNKFIKMVESSSEVSETMKYFVDEAKRRLEHIKEDEFFRK